MAVCRHCGESVIYQQTARYGTFRLWNFAAKRGVKVVIDTAQEPDTTILYVRDHHDGMRTRRIISGKKVPLGIDCYEETAEGLKWKSTCFEGYPLKPHECNERKKQRYQRLVYAGKGERYAR